MEGNMINIKTYDIVEAKQYSFNMANEYGFILISKGSAILTINDKKIKLSKLHYFVLSPYDIVKINNIVQTSYIIFRLKKSDLVRVSNGNNLEPLFSYDKNDLNSRIFDSTPHSITLLHTYINKFNDINNDELHFRSLQIDAWTILLLVHLFKLRSHNSRSKKHSRLLISEINEYCRLEITNPNLNLSMIAKHFNVSSSYITNFYKKNSGQNLMEAVMKTRLSLAVDHLTRGKNVCDVYQLIGFNTYNNFFKQFKKQYSMSPLEYIEYIKKQDESVN